MIATGRRDTAGADADGDRDRQLAERNEETADGLALAAVRWRENPL